ncbi:MAG: hypothetical protein L0219_21220 [Phycisphaerales bacterium]|nr:hypothetical protein [Phycisphaerales bacterium]
MQLTLWPDPSVINSTPWQVRKLVGIAAGGRIVQKWCTPSWARSVRPAKADAPSVLGG